MPFTQVTINAFGNFSTFINNCGNVLAASKTYFGLLAIALMNNPSLRLLWFKGGSFNVTELTCFGVVIWSRVIELGGLLAGDSERLVCGLGGEGFRSLRSEGPAGVGGTGEFSNVGGS
jgi:hypothetical protein